MSVRERIGHATRATFIGRVAAEGVAAVKSPGGEVNVRGYLDLMLEWSFPEPALRVLVMARGRVRRLRRTDDHPRCSGDSPLRMSAR
jgi:hypothetical protein